ncbi:MAG: helix-turn-helix transcriptional regulator [Treponema sp.]|nr:helix-turn-helix transcriptional regulator [Treponema sp.]
MFSTYGDKIYPGREMKIKCAFGIKDLDVPQIKDRFRIVFIKKGHATFTNGTKSQLVTAPAVLALNYDDIAGLSKSDELEMDIVYFSPFCYDRYNTETDFDGWKENLGLDLYYFRPFFEREDKFIGVVSIPQNTAPHIQRLIDSTDSILVNQPDDYWPCRSRSFLLELLITVNTVYSELENFSNPVTTKATERVQRIVEWINDNYTSRISLDDITREFNTNKTTLNLTFKAEMGSTVTAYIISLRMQMAGVLLKNTYLSVSEIVERIGYNDEAHFIRAFKKHTGSTPGEFRKQFDERYF